MTLVLQSLYATTGATIKYYLGSRLENRRDYVGRERIVGKFPGAFVQGCMEE